MESDLAKLSATLEGAQERVKSTQQMAKVNLLVAAEVSLSCF